MKHRLCAPGSRKVRLHLSGRPSSPLHIRTALRYCTRLVSVTARNTTYRHALGSLPVSLTGPGLQAPCILGVWHSAWDRAGVHYLCFQVTPSWTCPHTIKFTLKVDHSEVFLILTELCNHPHNLSPEYVHHPKKKPRTYWQSLAAPLTPQSTCLHGSASSEHFIQMESYSMCGLLGLASFTGFFHCFQDSSRWEQVSLLPFYCNIIFHWMDIPPLIYLLIRR